MPLPDVPVRVVQGENTLRPAYLVRFPEDVWAQMEKAQSTGGGISINMEDGMHLEIPGMAPIPLKSQSSGSSSEIYVSTQNTLTPSSVATSRLTLPLTSINTSRAVDNLKARNEAHEKERKDRADRVNGIKKAIPPPLDQSALNMARTMSNPVMPSSATSATTPTVPLKTRVVQLLALGPLSVEEIVSRVGMTAGEVIRVIKGVGREVPEGYGLQPAKYSGVKIAAWPYTYAEKQRVIKLAKQAFDELGYPEDADERADLDRKEAEVISGGSASSSDNIQTPPPVITVPPPMSSPAQTPAQNAVPVKKEKGAKKTGMGLIGKQRAKFQAEKRAASLPNVKKVEGAASPRPSSPMNNLKDTPLPETSKSSKRKREEDGSSQQQAKAAPKRASSPAKKPSPSSTNSSEESRGRPKAAKPVVKDAVVKDPGVKDPIVKDPVVGDRVKKEGKLARKKTRTSRSYSSSSGTSSDDEKRKTPISKLPKIPRKAPPPALELNNGHQEEPPDPETMRERYEELFPAYELLSRKLASLHREAEGEEEGEVVEMDPKELEKLVGRWQKWHRELEGIRRYFVA